MLYFLILKVAYLRHCFCFPIFTIFPSPWIIFFLSLSLSLSLSLFLYHFYFSNIPIFVSICCNQEVEAESLLTLPKYIVLFSCFASLFAVDFYSSCKKEEFLYDFHNITVRYQFVKKIFIFIIGVFDTMIFIITTKISTESFFLGMKWILYLFILILCKNDLVGFFFFLKGSSHYWNGRATSFISNCCQRLFDPWKFIKESFFAFFYTLQSTWKFFKLIYWLWHLLL